MVPIQVILRTSFSPAFSTHIVLLLPRFSTRRPAAGAVVPLFKFCPGLTSSRFDRYRPALKTTSICPLFPKFFGWAIKPRPGRASPLLGAGRFRPRPAPPPGALAPCAPPCLTSESSTFSWCVSKSLTPKKQSLGPCPARCPSPWALASEQAIRSRPAAHIQVELRDHQAPTVRAGVGRVWGWRVPPCLAASRRGPAPSRPAEPPAARIRVWNPDTLISRHILAYTVI